jgi:UDP-N-acetylmuramate--alanine ligase
MGIGGAGMSALAELLVHRGAAVTGCDLHPPAAGALGTLGVPVMTGHDAAHLAGVRAVVYSSAIPAGQPELARARSAGLPVIRRAEALADVVSDAFVVGVAGTHGKTTVTAMTTEALAAAGDDPTGVAGGHVVAWNGSVRTGSSPVYVVEADEYDRSFLALAPAIAVVTNLEADHLDIYRDLDDLRESFVRYLSGAARIVLCADDPGAAALAAHATVEVVRYGIDAADARLVARDLRSDAGAPAFSVWFDGDPCGEVRLQVPGDHNVRNALGALAVGLLRGLRVADMAPGLAAFAGVERRFQRLGEVAGVAIVDDYAHHPTEIRATVAAARSAFPGRRLVIAFQPHLFSRTRDFAKSFGEALALADVIFVADIYPARESPIEGVTAGLIVDAVRGAGTQVAWTGPRTALAAALHGQVRAGDVVLTVGAGDVTRTGTELLATLGNG